MKAAEDSEVMKASNCVGESNVREAATEKEAATVVEKEKKSTRVSERIANNSAAEGLLQLAVQYKNSTSLWGGIQLSVTAAVSVPVSTPWEEQIPPNAVRRKQTLSWRSGFSLRIDLGLCWTGVVISKGFTVRPLTCYKDLELRGQMLELRLLDLAEEEEADEFIIGIPKSSEGKETEKSNKVRSVVPACSSSCREDGEYIYRMSMERLLRHWTI